MIPKDFITEWRGYAPWTADAQVEQDLVISRALVAMFQEPELARRLAFRGGTALYKLHLLPGARYSEDIDLVQVAAEPIGETLDQLQAALNPWLGEPRRNQKQGSASLLYRFDSSDIPPLKLRLKVEMNTREHFSELGLTSVPFVVESRWFTGAADVTSFRLNELLGTKLRALYQRKKGRDLFDLWLALARSETDAEQVLQCFHRYMREGGHSVSRLQFEENLAGKAADADFRRDIVPLLRPGIDWDFDTAMASVREQLVEPLPSAARPGQRGEHG